MLLQPDLGRQPTAYDLTFDWRISDLCYHSVEIPQVNTISCGQHYGFSPYYLSPELSAQALDSSGPPLYK